MTKQTLRFEITTIPNSNRIVGDSVIVEVYNETDCMISKYRGIAAKNLVYRIEKAMEISNKETGKCV